MTTTHRLWIIAVLLAFATGITLRVVPLASFQKIGFDETLYRFYVTNVLEHGFLNYPQIVDNYIEKQRNLKGSILPPLRFLYIGVSSLWCTVSGEPPLFGLRQVASFFSILTLGVTFGFILRLAGRGAALAVLALMACAPTQIHMSQHALVDGFFTFWALLSLWLLWENLLRPSRPALLALYAGSLAFMVMTKENSAFVVIAILALLVANRWLAFGTVNRPLVAATLLGPAIGVGALITLAGGLDNFFACYYLSVTKNFTLEFAIKTGDGPWYRYLVDLMLVSPIVLLLALGTLFQLNRAQKPQLFVAVFMAASYLIMCNLTYGMNLRYANMWDAPLRLLAFTQLTVLTTRFGGKRQELWLVLSVLALCAYELRQYWILAIQFQYFYELVPETLLRALNILK